MSPYPLIYLPRDIAQPACCAHAVAFRARAGCGPDGSDGLVYGGPLPEPVVGQWLRTPAGWWLYHDGQQPQHLLRVDRHPRLQRWVWIDGASAGQRWLVPHLLLRDGNGDLVLAIDRQLTADGWQVGDDLRELVESLMAIEAGVPLHVEPEQRTAAVIDIAIRLLALGSWVDRDLLVALGWFTEDLAIRTLKAAMGITASPADGLGDA